MKSYAIVDIETRIEEALINTARYHGLGLTDDEAYQNFRKAWMAEHNGSDFLPWQFHIPISIAVGMVDQYYRLLDVKTLCPDRPLLDTDAEALMVHEFLGDGQPWIYAGDVQWKIVRPSGVGKGSPAVRHPSTEPLE